MLRYLRHLRSVAVLAAVLTLAACAEAELASYAVKQVQPEPPQRAGLYKVGQPYQVAGVWYYPKVDYDYRRTGIASWYGPKFHGKLTANGEVFDQYELTAAHPTLPMPSMVRVTNLENGRSVVVRVNDRGPFKNGRIIDVSTKAADLLGFRRKGTAKVLVEILDTESRQLATIAQSRTNPVTAPEPAPLIPVQSVALNGAGGAGANGVATNDTATNGTGHNGSAVGGHAQETAFLSPAAATDAAARAPLVEPQPDGVVTRRPVQPTNIYVQAGAFLRRDNAVRLGARLSVFGPTSITETIQDNRRFFRVRLGPVGSVEAADHLLAALLQSGHSEATVVVD